jgi:hypothetical protein
MPTKPKHVQDKVDQYIKEGYITKEIIELFKKDGEKVSSSYISTRRKEVNKNVEIKEALITSTSLSKTSSSILYDLLNRLGKKTIEETLTTISEDYRTILQEKIRYDFDNEKTVAQVFNEFKEVYKVLESLDKNARAPFIYYRMLNSDDDLNFTINFFDFLSESTIKYWRDERGVTISRIKFNGPLRISDGIIKK